MVACVSGHEDEGVWGGSHAREGADVAAAVAGRVEEVEGAVVEVVDGGETAGF